MKPLPRSFYNRDTEQVAKELLGKWLVHALDQSLRIGRVVETEAYLGPHDLAAHSARGRTPRTETMFGPPGYAYVYMIYGVHHCVNAVTLPEAHASAVLIRALEPVQGIEGKTSGPGLLCRALGIDRSHNGLDLTTGPLFFTRPESEPAFEIVARPRIGVDYAGEWAGKPLRFYIAGNAYISRK